MESMVLKVLTDNGIMVEKIKKKISDSSSIGLLHEPIEKFKVLTNIGEIRLVVKTESIIFPPEKLFRDLYSTCGNYESIVNLEEFDSGCPYLSIRDMPMREKIFYENTPDLMKQFIPYLWDCVIDNNCQILIMEDLGTKCLNMNQIDSPESWDFSLLLKAMNDLAVLHFYLEPLKGYIYHDYDFRQLKRFLFNFHMFVNRGCGITVESKVYEAGKKFIYDLNKFEIILSEIEVVLHNDFNIRNMCVSPNKEHIKIYDWEFWDMGCPMFDVVDFLLSISQKYINRIIIDELIGTYVKRYTKISGKKISVNSFFDLFYYSALKYSATRMNMYLLCYKRKKIKYIERMYINLKNILDLYEPKENGGCADGK